MRPTYRSILNEKERASERQFCWSMASCWRRLSRSSSCRPAVGFNDCTMWVYRVSHCPTFSVNSLWIIGVCYRGMLVSVGQSHDISLWSILSLGNRSINVEMIYKLPSLWYQFISHYTDNLCANFEVAPGRAHKRIWYACLTMSLHWFKLWIGAAYTTHYCLNKWWHKPTMYVCVTWP